MKRIMSILLAIAILISAFDKTAYADEAGVNHSTILFTHDMHSHLLPTVDENGNSTGGFARLASEIKKQKAIYPDALVLDGGDFSMGSLFQSIYATEAPELRLMGMMGYDATTFGNHEFDFRKKGFIGFLESAARSDERLPQLLEANYYPYKAGDDGYTADDDAVWSAFEELGVKEFTIIERGGVQYGIFGLMGVVSDSNAPESGMVFTDPIDTAKRVVSEIEDSADPAKPLLIICLSHSGTNEEKSESEDYQLASKVDGIDVILSGHTHSVLDEPLCVNNTIIVSCGCYTANLGVLDLTWNNTGKKTINSYELRPINASQEDDPEVAEKIEQFKAKVVEEYLSVYGFDSFEETVASNSIDFDTVNDVYNEHRESNLGDIIADAYYTEANRIFADDDIPISVAVTATGVIRDTIPKGTITVTDAFNISSLGVGVDGLAGYPLVTTYLTGKEIKALCEVDASVQPLMHEAQLHISGLRYTWNDNRLIFNKVTSCEIVYPDGSTEPVKDDGTYRLVSGLYCAQMLSAVKAKSFGILSIEPKDENGDLIEDFDEAIVHDSDGNEVKEWIAIAKYLQNENNGHVSAEYELTNCVSRKVEKDDKGLFAVISHPNRITFAIICIILAVILILFILIKNGIDKILYRRRHIKREKMKARREGRSIEKVTFKNGTKVRKKIGRRSQQGHSDYGRFYYVADDDSFDGTELVEPIDEFLGFVKPEDSKK